jgi:hypothetical protein
MWSSLLKKFRPAAINGRSGQIMVLTVLALGGTILGATTIAGLLMLYQIRQTTDLSNSARAIFAADAGMEHAFYDLFCSSDSNKSPCPLSSGVVFMNGSSVDILCLDRDNRAIDCNDSGVRRVRAVGRAGSATRAFEAGF